MCRQRTRYSKTLMKKCKPNIIADPLKGATRNTKTGLEKRFLSCFSLKMFWAKKTRRRSIVGKIAPIKHSLESCLRAPKFQRLSKMFRQKTNIDAFFEKLSRLNAAKCLIEFSTEKSNRYLR